MRFPPLIKGKFIRRKNRFVCEVEINGSGKEAVIRNTGRLKELLVPEAEIFLKRKDKGKYEYEIVLVNTDNGLICVDSHIPSELFVEFMRREGYPVKPESVKREVKVLNSRIDLLINERYLIETKSVNLIDNGVALFPDAPTERGKRHIEVLRKLSDTYEPIIVFVVQANFAKIFSPNYKTDEEFSRALENFYLSGFKVMAFKCSVEEGSIEIEREIPVVFKKPVNNPG